MEGLPVWGRVGIAFAVVLASLAVPGVGAVGPADAATESGTAVPGATEAPERLSTDGAGADDGQETTRPIGPVTNASTDGPTIALEQRFDLTPERPGEVTVRLRYRPPDAVTALRARVPQGATVTGTDGFVRSEASVYEWDERTAAPTLTYRIDPNETLDVEGPIAGRGEALFVDTGDYALLRAPPTPTGWSYRSDAGTVGLDLTRTAVGEAAFGDTMAYLGPHREVTRHGAGQQFRLILPARAELAASEAEIFDTLIDAADRLRVGDRDETVFAVAAPTRSVRWGVRGLQTGDADFWVRDTEPVEGASNVWIHEYVHTRQAYRAAPDARWVTEGMASYYAALLAFDGERTDFESFGQRLALGESTDAVLADPSTWETVAPYTRGALVAGEVDRRIRLATGGNRTLQDVFRRLNARGDIDGAAVVGTVRTVAGDRVATRTDRLVTTRDAVRMWNRSAHRTAFEGLAPRMNRTVEGLRVEGPYRTARTTAPLLATGERVNASVRVENEGTASGPYAVRLRVDGTVVARASGTLAPGEAATRELSWAPSAPGQYGLTVAGQPVTATVRRPATPSVTSVEVAPAEPTVGENATLTARVANPAPVPADGTVPVSVDGRTVTSRDVGLAPDQETTLRVELPVERAGPHVAGAGNRTATFEAVAPPTPTVSPTATPTNTATPVNDTATPTDTATSTKIATPTNPATSAATSPDTATSTPAGAAATSTPEPAATTGDGPAPGPAGAAFAVVLAVLLLRRR